MRHLFLTNSLSHKFPNFEYSVFQWVELLDPKSQRTMYVNLRSGECCWDPPVKQHVKPMNPDQWWELYDVNAGRNYYYNSATKRTVWERPSHPADIIPLAKLQLCQQSGINNNSGDNKPNTTYESFDSTTATIHIMNVFERENWLEFVKTLSIVVDKFPRDHGSETHPKNPPPPNPLDSFNPKVDGDCTTSPSSLTTTMSAALQPRPTAVNHRIWLERRPKPAAGCLSDKPVRRRNTQIIQSGDFSLLTTCNPTGSLLIDHHVPAANNTTTDSPVPIDIATVASSSPVVQQPLFRQSVPTSLFTSAAANSTIDRHRLNGSGRVLEVTSSSTNQQFNALRSEAARQLEELNNYRWHRQTASSNPTTGFDPMSSSSSSNTCDRSRQAPRPFPRTNPACFRSRDGTSTLIIHGAKRNQPVARQPSFEQTSLSSRLSDSTGSGDDRLLGSMSALSLHRRPSTTTSSNSSYQTANLLPSMADIGDRSSAVDKQPAVSQQPIEHKTNLAISPSKREIVTRLSCTTTSSNSESPRPQSSVLSASSSSSYSSRASTDTELSDDDQSSCDDQRLATFEEFRNVVDSSRVSNVHHPTPINQNDPSGRADNEKLPVPPPRSASTLGSQRLTVEQLNIAQNAFFNTNNRYHPNAPNDFGHNQPQSCSIDYLTVSPGTGISTMSRQHPLRSNVYQPNHRRPPPFYWIPNHQVPCDDMARRLETNLREVDAEVIGRPEAARDIPMHGTTSSTSSSLLVNGHSLQASLIDSTPPTTFSTITSTDCASSTSNLLACSGDDQLASSDHQLIQSSTRVKRSTSGGFIGPLSHTDHHHPSPHLVHPGHPGFALFIGPYDWSPKVIKSRDDKEGLTSFMSWTKSNFSKRLLIHTESNMKKQVAQQFKLKYLTIPVKDENYDIRPTRSGFYNIPRIIKSMTTSLSLQPRPIPTITVIQSIMGHRKSRLSQPDCCSILVQRALACPALRDELYAQLCKQTTCNSDMKSLTSAWALLCVCLYYFPPNSRFHDALLDYLQVRAKSALIVRKPVNGGIASSLNGTGGTTNSGRLLYGTDADCGQQSPAHFACVAPRWFKRASQLPSRSISLSSDPTTSGNGQAPKLDEICHVKEFVLKPPLYGSSVDDILFTQRHRFPTLLIPWIQVFLAEEILRLDGAQTEGIFRLSPDTDMLGDIRVNLEKLFEVFRLVSTTPNSTNSSSADHSLNEPLTDADCIAIHRPPPANWSLFSARLPPSSTGESVQPTSPCHFPLLTGVDSKPLLPLPLSLPPPSDYVLITPASHWPLTLADCLTNPSINPTDCDAHLAAGLLKQWLRELDQPLIPEELQSACLTAASEAELLETADKSLDCATNQSASDKMTVPIQTCCRLIRSIPPSPRRCLLHLIALLQAIPEDERGLAECLQTQTTLGLTDLLGLKSPRDALLESAAKTLHG